ncbi:MAG: response regulator transcription factor [Solirubrobacterales bacterium]|nr:response regulator transcription factor [Solirubrobacterales bacterium]
MLSMQGEIATIVVCEDDEPTLDLLCEHLFADRFEVLPAPGAADALRLCRYNHPDLLLLDLALPDASGLDVIREIRESDEVHARYNPRLPIIALTGRGAASDRVRGFDLGADDYVQKPFGYDELRARITAVLRRGHSRKDGPVQAGEILVDAARRKVMVGDREVHLAKKEFTLLRVLASDPTRVFSKDELLRDVWGFKAPAGKTRTLDSHASRLRQKLDPEEQKYVINTWGIGYRLTNG